MFRFHPWSFIRSPGWVQIKCELRYDLLEILKFKNNSLKFVKSTQNSTPSGLNSSIIVVKQDSGMQFSPPPPPPPPSPPPPTPIKAVSRRPCIGPHHISLPKPPKSVNAALQSRQWWIELFYRFKRAKTSRISVLNIRKLYLYFFLH